MYVRALQKGESLYLFDGKVKIQVVSITGSIVRLGLETPPEVDIKTEKQLLDEYAAMKEIENETST